MKMLFAVLFASMLLLAGCPGEEQAGGAPAPSGGQPSAPSQPGAPSEPGPGEGGTAPAEGGGEASPFESWDVQAMMALGQPVYCTMTYSEEGMMMTSEMYLKGEMMRADSVSMLGGDSYESIVVFKNDMAYVAGTQSMMMEGMEDCDWMTLDNKRLEECMPAEEGVSFDTESYSAEAYDATPDDFSCSYGTFGDEVFDTPGTVCDLSEQLCEMYESMSAGGFGTGGLDESLCEGMEGQDYEDCIEAISQYG